MCTPSGVQEQVTRRRACFWGEKVLPPQAHVTNLDTPQPSQQTPPREPLSPIRIGIDFDGAITWDGAVIDRLELDESLKA